MSPGGPPTTPSRRAAWHENWAAAIASIARAVPGGVVERIGEVTIVRSGLAITAFNCAFVLDAPQHPREVGERIEQILARGATRWCLVTMAKSAPSIEPMLRSLRLRRHEILPGMVWDPLPLAAPSDPPGLEIRRVRDAAGARIFGRTMMAGFGTGIDLLDPWIEGVAEGGVPPPGVAGYYVGFSKGRPVSTAVRYSTRDVAGIYGVSTVPEFRRRGWGAAMTSRAAIDARAEGCQQSYLQSSEMGRSVYERLGYRLVEEYQLWVPDLTVPG